MLWFKDIERVHPESKDGFPFSLTDTVLVEFGVFA